MLNNIHNIQAASIRRIQWWFLQCQQSYKNNPRRCHQFVMRSGGKMYQPAVPHWFCHWNVRKTQDLKQDKIGKKSLECSGCGYKAIVMRNAYRINAKLQTHAIVYHRTYDLLTQRVPNCFPTFFVIILWWRKRNWWIHRISNWISLLKNFGTKTQTKRDVCSAETQLYCTTDRSILFWCQLFGRRLVRKR